jgi:hypothetical protein
MIIDIVHLRSDKCPGTRAKDLTFILDIGLIPVINYPKSNVQLFGIQDSFQLAINIPDKLKRMKLKLIEFQGHYFNLWYKQGIVKF